MKKRHEQKLIILSVVLVTLLGLPLVLIFDSDGAVFGIPTFYFSILVLWALTIIISYIVLKRHYE